MSSDRIGLDQVLVQQEVDEAELAAVAFLARYSASPSHRTSAGAVDRQASRTRSRPFAHEQMVGWTTFRRAGTSSGFRVR
jgi:hypothetical protein